MSENEDSFLNTTRREFIQSTLAILGLGALPNIMPGHEGDEDVSLGKESGLNSASHVRNEVELPPCGMFLGSGVYPMSKDYLLSTLYSHQSWMPESFSQEEIIDKIISDNQGNLAQVWGTGLRGYAPITYAEWQYALDEIGIEVPKPDWQDKKYLKASKCEAINDHPERNGAGIMRFIRKAAEKGIYTMMIYAGANAEWSHKLKENGKYYIGYDYGESYTFGFGNNSIKDKELQEVNLRALGDDLVERVRKNVDKLHSKGWGSTYATSGDFFIDYEIAGGTETPLIEDFAFSHLNFASAISRGLYRQFDLPIWGSHLAHEHYSWIPNASKHKWNLLKAAMYQKYMSGSKIIINESGNWFVEATLCIDSPKFDFPHVPLKPDEVSWMGDKPIKFIPYIKEARKYFPEVNYNAPIPRRYRREISDFYDFIKANGTPEGQPESTVAIAKGNYDLCHQRYSPQYAIAGTYKLADKNPKWFEGVPERGWETVRKIFYPTPNVIEPYENPFLSGTPFGQVDIVSFVQDKIDASFLNNYKALLFSGWNTSSDRQYKILKKYVKNGGTLFISIPQLSTNTTRDFGDYSVDELVNRGDFSDLCGVKVLSRGKRIYWATVPYDSHELGVEFPRRFGILATPMGNIEITDPDIEVLAVDDELGKPLVLRHQYGKGEVYFLNSWSYPGAFDQDFGPGSTRTSPGLVGIIYRHIAKNARGKVWITDDKEEPGKECNYINVSYFPEAHKVCLYNIDFQQPHKFFLHAFDRVIEKELQKGEFEMIDMG